MGLTKHQRIGAGILLAIFVSGLLNIVLGAPKLNPEVSVTALAIMGTFHLITIAVCVFYTWIALRQLLPSDDYVRPERLSLWQKASILVPITFVLGGASLLFSHMQSGGFSTESDPELQVVKLWILTISLTIIATIATIASLIWHKWQTVQQYQETPVRDMFLREYPKLVETSLAEVLQEGKLRSDLREVIEDMLDDIEREGNTSMLDITVFTNAYETRHSRAAVFYTACLDRLGHEVKQDPEYVARNKQFRESKTPAHLLTTHEPASDYVSHLVAHDRRKGVLIIMSWPYRIPRPSRRLW